MALIVAVALVLVLAAGCGGDPVPDAASLPKRAPTIGPDDRWRPPSLSRAVAEARPVRGMRCTRGDEEKRFGVHLELFARREVMIVAAGIGVAPPRTRDGAYIRGGRCTYPLRTREPTGVIEAVSGRSLTLGHLFALWDQPLTRRRLGAFRGRVNAYVAGRPWRGDPRRIPLRRHAQIVLQVQGHVPPHATYRFPPGL